MLKSFLSPRRWRRNSSRSEDPTDRGSRGAVDPKHSSQRGSEDAKESSYSLRRRFTSSGSSFVEGNHDTITPLTTLSATKGKTRGTEGQNHRQKGKNRIRAFASNRHHQEPSTEGYEGPLVAVREEESTTEASSAGQRIIPLSNDSRATEPARTSFDTNGSYGYGNGLELGRLSSESTSFFSCRLDLRSGSVQSSFASSTRSLFQLPRLVPKTRENALIMNHPYEAGAKGFATQSAPDLLFQTDLNNREVGQNELSMVQGFQSGTRRGLRSNYSFVYPAGESANKNSRLRAPTVPISGEGLQSATTSRQTSASRSREKTFTTVPRLDAASQKYRSSSSTKLKYRAHTRLEDDLGGTSIGPDSTWSSFVDMDSASTSDNIPFPIHGNCPKCHHWHNKFIVPLSLDPGKHTRIMCERCSRPWFSLGGNSTHTSLLSQETLIDGRASDMEDPTVIGDAAFSRSRTKLEDGEEDKGARKNKFMGTANRRWQKIRREKTLVRLFSRRTREKTESTSGKATGPSDDDQEQDAYTREKSSPSAERNPEVASASSRADGYYMTEEPPRARTKNSDLPARVTSALPAPLPESSIQNNQSARVQIASVSNLQLSTFASGKGNPEQSQKLESEQLREIENLPVDRNGPTHRAPQQEPKTIHLNTSESSPTSVTLKWTCSCGAKFEELIREYAPGAVQAVATELNQPTQNRDASQPSSSLSSGAASKWNIARPRNPYGREDEVAIDVEKQDIGLPEQDPPTPERCVLLCMPSKGRQVLEHATVTACTQDRDMYRAFHRCYYTPLRRLIRWLSFRTLDNVNFTRFLLYTTHDVAIGAADLGLLPPETRRDYLYDYDWQRRRLTEPVIPLTALKHFTEYPSHVKCHMHHLERMPTKIDGRLCWPKSDHDGEEIEGWGLRFKECVSSRKVWVAEGFWAVAATVFAVIWCRYHDGDLQDAFGVSSFLIACGTIVMGLVQGFAQHLEKEV